MGGHPRGEIPQVPTPLSRRGRMVARQRIDDARGRFTERVQDFPFPAIAPGDTSQAQGIPFTVTSMGSRYVRLRAMRGVVSSTTAPLTGAELGLVSLRIQMNGENDLIGGNETNFASFALLFGNAKPAPPTVSLKRVSPPWFWFLSPPVFRAGDTLTLTATNTSDALVLTPEVGLRLMDEYVWQELYTRDWQRERSA